MKVKEMQEEFAAGIVQVYEKRRSSGMAHQESWEKAVASMMEAMSQIDILAQMDAAHELGKKYDLKTGEVLKEK